MANEKSFKIVEKFKYFICVSLVVILVGLTIGIINVATGKNFINFGIDFTGGATIDIDLGDFARQDENRKIIEEELTKLITEEGCRIEGAMTSSLAGDGGATYEFRLAYYKDGKALITDKEGAEFVTYVKGELSEKITDKLMELFEENETLKNAGAVLSDASEGGKKSVTAYGVSGSAAGSLTTKAIIALAVAIVVMLIYIVFRFTLSSALAAVCALVHDVLIMIALVAVFNIPVNSTFIAAVITIVGYSINATIIIFDRIREQLKLESSKTTPDADMANYAIKDTLNRTILTTITTLVMVVALVFFSVATIREFILPIIFGLLAGAFSSICLAPAFWCMFRKIGKKIQANKQAKTGYQAAKAEKK